MKKTSTPPASVHPPAKHSGACDPKDMPVTGWDNGLCQDYDRKLFRWFASRIDARYQLRRALGIN